MRHFDEIFAIAADRHGGPQALESQLEPPLPREQLMAIPDDRWLSQFSKNVFSAGFNWKVIENKWPGFEEAFHRFDIGRCAMMDDAWFDQLVTDNRIVRHGPKILSVRDNAAFFQALSQKTGQPAGATIAQWPTDDYVGLLAMLKTHGSRLGGTTGQYALRFIGADGFILSRDVVARLVAEGVIDRAPTSKKAMAQVQDAFRIWRRQSGRSLKEISRVLAMSIG